MVEKSRASPNWPIVSDGYSRFLHSSRRSSWSESRWEEGARDDNFLSDKELSDLIFSMPLRHVTVYTRNNSGNNDTSRPTSNKCIFPVRTNNIYLVSEENNKVL